MKKSPKVPKILQPALNLYMEFYYINAKKFYLIAYILSFSKPLFFTAGFKVIYVDLALSKELAAKKKNDSLYRLLPNK